MLVGWVGQVGQVGQVRQVGSVPGFLRSGPLGNGTLDAALLDNLEGDALAVPGRGGAQEIADGIDGMAMLSNDLANIGLAELKAKSDFFWRLEPGQHHLIGKLDQLPDDVFEKLFHAHVLGQRDNMAQAARAEGLRIRGASLAR